MGREARFSEGFFREVKRGGGHSQDCAIVLVREEVVELAWLFFGKADLGGKAFCA